MFEKKIKEFFNSVTICGEEPTKKAMLDKRILMMAGVTTGIAVAVISAGIAMLWAEFAGKDDSDEDNDE